MNNLKRVFSLGLAGAMMSGMMMVGASAASTDFIDKDEIKHTEAVDTLTSLNVIGGDQNGAYNPEDNLTRAQMAKLVTFVMYGGKEPNLSNKATSSFTDVASNHWAKNYIEYCYVTGIIGGMGDGTFAPDANLTGTQAAKMLLVAMGYDAKAFNFIGADWAMNTSIEANKAGLLEKLDDMQLSEKISRDDAAQMVYNAVQAPTMKVEKSMTNGVVTETYKNNGPTLLADKFKVNTDKGILTDVSYNKDKAEYTYTVGGSDYIVADDLSDLFMQNVEVLYKTVDGKDVVYGIHTKDSKTVATDLVLGDIKKPDGTATKVKIAGTEYKLDDQASKINVYSFLDDTTPLYQLSDTISGEAKAYGMDLVDSDNDGKVDLAIAYPFTVAQVSFVGQKSFNAGKVYKFEDVDVYEGVAKDDFVMITTLPAGTAKNTVIIEKLEKNTAKAEAMKGSTDIMLDGSWYKQGKASTDVLVSAAKAGTDYEYVAVNGYLFHLKGAETATGSAADYVIVTDIALTPAGLKNTYTANLLKTDGTVATVELTATATKGNAYTYKVNDDGNYELTAVTSSSKGFDAVSTNATFNVAKGSTKATFKENDHNNVYHIADDAVVFVKNGDKYSVTDGTKLKSTTSTISTVGFIAADKDSATGYTNVKLAYVTSASLGEITSDYGYVTGDVIVKAAAEKDKFVAEIPVGDTVLVTEAVKTGGVLDKATALSKGTAFKYELNADGAVKDITPFTFTALSGTENALDFTAAVVAMDGNSIRFNSNYFASANTATGTNNSYDAKLTDKTVIIYVDEANKTVAEGGDIQLATKGILEKVDGTARYFANVRVSTNADEEVVLMIVDINNDILGLM